MPLFDIRNTQCMYQSEDKHISVITSPQQHVSPYSLFVSLLICHLTRCKMLTTMQPVCLTRQQQAKHTSETDPFGLLLLLLLLHSPAISLGFTIFRWDFSVYVTIFQSKHWGGHISPSWMVHAGCLYVASIHLSRTWMSGSFETVQWNACVHRLDPQFTLLSEKVFGEWGQNPC